MILFWTYTYFMMKHQKSHHLLRKRLTFQASLPRCSSNPFKFWRRTLLKRTLIKGVHLQVTSGCFYSVFKKNHMFRMNPNKLEKSVAVMSVCVTELKCLLILARRTGMCFWLIRKLVVPQLPSPLELFRWFLKVVLPGGSPSKEASEPSHLYKFNR